MCCVALMDSMLCCVTNLIMNECMYVSEDGLIIEVCMRLALMLDFDWLDVLLGSPSMSVLSCVHWDCMCARLWSEKSCFSHYP